MLEKGREIRRMWKIGVDEDLSMEERKIRWRLVEKNKDRRGKRKKSGKTTGGFG